MNKDEKLALPVADGWQVRPVDHEHAAVVFTAGSQRIGVVLPNEGLAQFVSHALNAAARYTPQNHQPEDGQAIDAVLVPVSALAEVPGRTPEESILAAKTGSVTLSLAVPSPILLQFAAQVVASTIRRDGQARH